MGIDIRTIILILGITHLMQVLVFIYQYKANKNISGPGWWLMWSAFESLGFALILLRSIPELLPLIIIFQNIILLLGTIFIYFGILRFFDRKVNLKFVIPFFLVFLFLHFYFIFIIDDISIRSINISAFLSAISFLTAISIIKHKTNSTVLTSNFNAFLFILHGCIFAYRAIMISLGTDVTDIFQPTSFNFLPYFDSLIVSLLWTFGFIMMLNQRLNAEISEAKTHFELIFNTSPDAAIIHRLDDNLFIDCNESFTRISGYTKDDISGDSSIENKIWENQDDRLQIIRMIEENGFCENHETLFQRKDGNFYTGLVSAKLLTLKGIPHIVTVTRDITERKQVEEEIKIKNKELKRLNIEKDKFFSIISHDLRSPFNSFLGLTEIMVEQLPQMTLLQIQEIALTMRNSATNLYKLLENLLEWSRIEQGLYKFKPVTFQLLPLIEESLILIKESANSKEIDIINNIPNDFSVFADKNILQTVVRNLTSNAVKFTPRGGIITIDVELNKIKTFIISIKDSGIGMNQSMVENLFNFNTQTSRKGTENETSTGLGLVLCKMLVEKHNGRIWVESEEDKGSIFYVAFPHNSESEEKS